MRGKLFYLNLLKKQDFGKFLFKKKSEMRILLKIPKKHSEMKMKKKLEFL